jgi:SulP family sulfate permease
VRAARRQAERDALKGILSSSLIASFTGGFGGTKVQASGPTAPMTAVTFNLVEYARDPETFGPDSDLPDTDVEKWINMVLLLSGLTMAMMGVLQLGQFITVVPNVVISGFMDGIALLIWQDQVRIMFGIGREGLSGPLWANLLMLGLCVTHPLPHLLTSVMESQHSILLPEPPFVFLTMERLSASLCACLPACLPIDR